MDEPGAARRAALLEQRDHLRAEITSLGADPDSDEATFVGLSKKLKPAKK